MEQCAEQQGAWNRSASFPFLFPPSTSHFHPPAVPLSLALFPSRRGALLLFLRAAAALLSGNLDSEYRSEKDSHESLERDSRNFTYVRATGNSVNSKSAGRERRPEPLLDSQSLFIRFMVLRFHGARAPPWCSGGKRVSFCYAPSNRGTSVRLITSRLFERARLDIDFSEKKSDTILRFEISKTNY